MYKPVQQCDHCGANLTLDDLRGTQCPYCKVVYPHHSQAQQHVQVIGQVMGQMMQGQTMHQRAQIQNQWRGAFGAPPIAPPPGASPGSPYPYDPNQMMQAHMQHAQQMSRRITTIILVATIGGFVLVAAIVALTMIL